MSVVLNLVQRGVYRDSVTLMRASREVEGRPGVQGAALMIGTPSNKALLAEAGLLAAEGKGAGASDLILAVRAENEADAKRALTIALAALEGGRSQAHGGAFPRVRTLAGALEARPDARLAVISVPGAFAAHAAKAALARGLHAFIFSDNVPLEDELALKRLGRERGLLVMGPDCGTALLGGVPVAFANAVPRGDIGLVSASGTGLQEVSTLLARLGRGVSHGIGVGGRDLDARIGGLSTLTALELLRDDPATGSLVVISKPPAAEVAARMLAAIEQAGKPAIVCFLGAAELRLPPNARLARTLAEAAELAAGASIPDEGLDAAPPALRGIVSALYCGGTLCTEAELVFRGRGLRGHRFVDLGADEHTRGRPHPMLEPALRTPHIHAALADARVGALLVDVVLGYGAHPDPAGVLIDALGGRPAKPVIASVTGTDADPQVRSAQVARLRAAGVLVAASNAHAAAYAAKLASQCSPA